MFRKVRNTALQESLNIKSLPLRSEKSQLEWLGHVSKMPQERLPRKLYMLKLI